MSTVKRKAGRPRTGTGLNEALILKTARKLLAKEKEAFSIRSLAKKLGADPMAVYHYYKNKKQLLEAVCLDAMDEIYEPNPAGRWQMELTKLVESYIELLRSNPGLLETMVQMAEGPASVFEERFMTIAPPGLNRRQTQEALHLLADYMHGFALGLKYVTKPADTAAYMASVKGPLRIYMAGLTITAG